MPTITLLSGAIIPGLLLPLGLVAFVTQRRRGRQEAPPLDAPAPLDQALRHLRHAGGRLRGIGLVLHGAAGAMARTGDPMAAIIAEAADDAFALAEDMHACALQVPAVRAIQDEIVHLHTLVEEALGDVGTNIAPGRREWLALSDTPDLQLRADRRALRFILRDALSLAIRATADGDSITIRQIRDEHEITVRIEYAARGDSPPAFPLGLDEDDPRPDIARQLAEAHGGRIEFAAVRAGRGSIALALPIARLIAQGSPD